MSSDITKILASGLLPKRPVESHKYTFGSVLVIGGSRHMPGAAALASEAVLSAGAGVVTLAAPESVFEAGLLLPEVMRLPLHENHEGTFGLASCKELMHEDLAKYDVFVVGPGMSHHDETQRFFEVLLVQLMRLKKFVVLDADALNCLSEHPAQLNNDFILTPHIGEGRRLLQANNHPAQMDMARRLRQKYQAQIVLKSAHTIVAGSDGTIWRNTTGTSGLATAGSGDVLSGTIAAFLAQGCKPLAAAQLGVYVHGRAGELAAKRYTAYGVRAGLVSEFLAPALKELTILNS